MICSVVRGLLVTISILSVFVSSLGLAQSKHPRVVILEKNLAADITRLLEKIVGNKPFYVDVFIEPLRPENDQDGNRLNLPLLGYVDRRESDVWDDLEVPDHVLLKKVTRVTVQITLDQTVPDFLIEDIKKMAKKQWPFVEGRDFITVEKKSLQVTDQDQDLINAEFFKKIATIFLGLLVVYLIAQLLNGWMVARKIARAVGSVKVELSGQSGGGGHFGETFAQGSAGALPSVRGFEMSDGGSGGMSGDTRITGGELQLHDTIRIAELIQQWVLRLKEEKNFPSLEDMKILEEEVHSHAHSVGALLHAFPVDIKNKVVAFSKSEKWFLAIADPGILDSKCFSIMSHLMKISRNVHSELEERLLVYCWYAEEKLLEFLKRIDQEDALWILSQLPKNLSLAVGREYLPGRWALLLDVESNELSKRRINPEVLNNYVKILEELKPLRTIDLVEKYKRQHEILKYVSSVDPVVEKEIYLASGENSGLSLLRPPYYVLFELSNEELNRVLLRVPLETLALSLFNIPKDLRSKVDKNLSDKQRFVLVDYLKKWDKRGVTKEKIAEARNHIGWVCHEVVQVTRYEKNNSDISTKKVTSSSEAA
ncbi:MAG: hypothetical protein RMK80_03435 [Pseudobdellovibrionaceae bacterium]|nr:hypothetical protein [Pseudobdellovibrionaceae bacterium]